MRLLQILRSRLLDCGCLVGVYETYAGQTVEIVDFHAHDCIEPTHKPGVVLRPTLEPPRAA